MKEKTITKVDILNTVYSSNLPSRAVTVIFYLINRCNREMTCFPAVKTISKDCSISIRTVRRALKDLVKVGLVKKESRWRENGGQSSNLYTLQILKNKKSSRSKNTEEKDQAVDKEPKTKSQEAIKNIDFSYYVKENPEKDIDNKDKLKIDKETNRIKDNNSVNELETVKEYTSKDLKNQNKTSKAYISKQSSIFHIKSLNLLNKVKNNIKACLQRLKLHMDKGLENIMAEGG
ncbi:helix-turn-helix domain-containing protein [Maledivibacter halophilus]|uniref:Helix-turn-helix domain-containing protein n=1 Tax=Maledivibacter halophilus TaxID=36842 RepID=A0A1T5LWB6_9FIRM|nr:helix-turn-helix domain-containing protein [Maledivibacter halophilus]SKC79868.1 Helix-turn-helix domain-containing protein [Maledivibacter halophilus]